MEGERQTAGEVRDVLVVDVPFGKVKRAWLNSTTPRVQNGKLKARTRDEHAANTVCHRCASSPGPTSRPGAARQTAEATRLGEAATAQARTSARLHRSLDIA